MYPGHHAHTAPDKPAAIHARTGEVLTYADLDARSNRLAQLLWSEGLRPGDHVAVFLENHLRYFEVAWWGPILHEYYGGTEANGLTYVGPEDWLAHPGTVGRAVMGKIRICNEDGAELPIGEAGIVYFERGQVPFSYHKDPEKTRGAQHPVHPTWTALGDVGYVDDEGYLYLTDRVSFMIISGGVNIYPQEIENELIMHPKVDDVAVVGVPHPEFGEEVKAVVQPVAGVDADSALAEELIAFARERLAPYKCPRSIDFETELPRLPTGKLYKRLLKDRYWGEKNSRIV